MKSGAVAASASLIDFACASLCLHRIKDRREKPRQWGAFLFASLCSVCLAEKFILEWKTWWPRSSIPQRAALRMEKLFACLWASWGRTRKCMKWRWKWFRRRHLEMCIYFSWFQAMFWFIPHQTTLLQIDCFLLFILIIFLLKNSPQEFTFRSSVCL